MTRRRPLRADTILLAALTVLTGLSGCTAPDAPDAPTVEQGALDAAFQAVDLLPSPALRSALGDPSDMHPTAPATLHEALGSWVPIEPVPLPEPVPLSDALAAYADSRDVPADQRPDLDAGVAALDLSPRQEAAVSRLVLAFLEAERLQAQAVRDLTVEEMLFIGHDPTALEQWSQRTGGGSWSEYEAEVQRILERLDFARNLQAADLLARAVEDARDAWQDAELPSQSVPASNHPTEPVDGDGDGTPGAAEGALGMDDGDPDDNAGSALSGDPNGKAVRLPPRDAPVSLPGLLILGPGSTTMDEDVDLLIDVGGDDTYTARDFGGVRPVWERTVTRTPGGAAGQLRVSEPRMVKLVADLGGNDIYEPEHVQSDGSTDGLFSLHVDSTPSLGGAVLGVSILADAGGKNTFASSGAITSTARQTSTDDQDAKAIGYGVTQGAGMFGGVGVLATWDATNEATVSLEVQADEVGSNTKTPVAVAVGAAQGGGWLGFGVMALFGSDADVLDVHVDARTPDHDGNDPANGITDAGAIDFAAAQGAARGGAGILIDQGGDAEFSADAPVAQASAWSLERADSAGFDEDPVSARDPNTQDLSPILDTHSTLGILWASDGDGTYRATDLAQASALGYKAWGKADGEQAWYAYEQSITRNHPNPAVGITNADSDNLAAYGGWAPALAILVEPGGHDVYDAVGDRVGAGAQGAGMLGGVALLLDLSGDDRYEARDSGFNQGAGWLGQGVLVDQFGHDTYHAAQRAQGYATDDPMGLAFVGLCHGMPSQATATYSDVYCTRDAFPPLNKGNVVEYEEGTGQVDAAVRAQVPTLGALVDRHGIDRYVADDRAQGFANPVLQYAGGAGACRSHQIRAVGSIVRVGDPLPGYLPYCNQHYPGDTIDGETQPWQEENVAPPPSNGFLLGLLLDAAGHDAYVYGGQKEAYPDGGEGPEDGNEWVWEQTETPERDLGDAKVPEDLGPAPDPQQIIPAESIPGATEAVYGFGIDEDAVKNLEGLGASLPAPVLAQAAPIRLTMTILKDDQGTVLDAETEVATGTIYLQLDVENPRNIPLESISFLADSLLVRRVAGGEATYLEPWETESVDEAGFLVYPDGTYWVQASAILDLPGPGLASVESDGHLVDLNNPPLLDVNLDPPHGMVSPKGTPLELELSITPDLEFPELDGLSQANRDRVEQIEADGGQPGAFVTVSLDGPTQHELVSNVYQPGNEDIPIPVDGTCGIDAAGDPVACPDGAYTLTVLAVDRDGNPTEETIDVLVDGEAPRSRITLETIDGVAYAGVEYNDGPQILSLPWTFDNDPLDVGDVADVEAVHVFRVDEDGEAVLLESSTSKRTRVEGVSTGDLLTFVTVGEDELGNMESACLPSETAPLCTLAKRGEADPVLGPKEVFVDFLRPVIEGAGATHEFVQPGVTDVAFEAQVKEEGSGLASVTVRFDDGSSFAMTDPDGDGKYVFDAWSDFNSGLRADEEAYFYTIRAVDLAGNAETVERTGILDNVPPSVQVLETVYRLGDTERSAGRAGARVDVRLIARDASVAGATADFSTIHDEIDPAECILDLDTLDESHDRVCTAFLPAGVEDGTYTVPLSVVDEAGNEALADATVLVSDAQISISDVRVVDVGTDYVVVEWTTDKPATSQVLYGKTRELGMESELDPELRLEHRVTVSDLPAATNLFVAAASENLAGTQTVSDSIDLTTGSALSVAFPSLTEGQILTDEVEVEVQLGITDSDPSPASVVLLSERPDGLGGRQRLGDGVESAGGTLRITVDTTLLDDGPVRFVAQSVRGRDLFEKESPTVVVDNTAPVLVPLRPLPGLDVDADEPVFDLLVFNAGGGTDVDPASVAVTLDGREASPVVEVGAGTTSRTLRITLPSGLDPGEHELGVAVADEAGKVAKLDLPFSARTDVDGDATGIDYGGLEAARPGAGVRFVYDSDQPLDAVQVDTAPASADTVPLERQAEWVGTWTVPATLASGTYQLGVQTTSVYGDTNRIAGVFELVVDADAPTLDTSLSPAGPAGAALVLSADEPVRVEVLRGGVHVARSDALDTRHELDLAGLPHGSLVEVTVRAVDGAGNAAERVERAILPRDVAAPTAVDDLSARADGGTVVLTWSPATDDAGVHEYVVERDGWSRHVAGTSVRDRDAPGGREATYRVHAVDAAGNAGPAETVTVAVAKNIEIVESEVFPTVGNTTTPFDMRVGLRHNLDGAPNVTLIIDGTPAIMTPDDPGADCRDACWYAVQTRLPATRAGAPLRVELDVAGDGDAPMPVPTAVTVVQVAEAQDESAPAVFLLLPLLAALIVARRWRR